MGRIFSLPKINTRSIILLVLIRKINSKGCLTNNIKELQPLTIFNFYEIYFTGFGSAQPTQFPESKGINYEIYLIKKRTNLSILFE